MHVGGITNNVYIITSIWVAKFLRIIFLGVICWLFIDYYCKVIMNTEGDGKGWRCMDILKIDDDML